MTSSTASPMVIDARMKLDDSDHVLQGNGEVVVRRCSDNARPHDRQRQGKAPANVGRDLGVEAAGPSAASCH